MMMAAAVTTSSSAITATSVTTSRSMGGSCRRRKVAIIGGGITGATVATTLAARGINVDIHVFDQGRSGVGGRTNHRVISQKKGDNDNDDEPTTFRWDHGCQFFRADTSRFQTVLKDWIDQKQIAAEWQGNFLGESGGADFFGLPSRPPFYVGVGGIRRIAQHLLHETSDCIQVFEGHRVTGMTRDDTTRSGSTSGSGTTKTWTLFGTNGEAAYHDSAEAVAQASTSHVIGENYDVIVMTDISSSFSSWHRASAGVPQDFADRVRTRAGSRVPLFTCMIAFDTPVPVDISAATLNDPTLWFVARSNDKPGLDHLTRDCWTLVSTPEYALQAIAETPMQDPVTGEFLPQDPEYLRRVPAADMEAAFRRIVQEGRLGGIDRGDRGDSGGGGGGAADEAARRCSRMDDSIMPKTCHVTAQRWGSALPAHRHLLESSPTRMVISGVAYDPGRGSLAPTQLVTLDEDETVSSSSTTTTRSSYVADEELMLFQAGDMVSSYTPGFEGAVLSGMDAADRIAELLSVATSSD